MAQVKSTEIAKRLLPITATVGTWKGTNKEYNKKDLEALGLEIERTVVLPFFHRDDFLNGKSLTDGYKRVVNELDNAIKLWDTAYEQNAAHGDNALPKEQVKVTVVNPEGKEAELANPRDVFPTNGMRKTPDGREVAYTVADFLFDGAISGCSLAFQAEHGKTMRDGLKAKLGSPKGAGTGRGNRADSAF
jgi:hypothetical protein